MQMLRLKGLIAAAYTPFQNDGSLKLNCVAEIVEHLLKDGIQGIYVCGSTGEGPSLTTEERRSVAEAYVQAADGSVPVIVQVGHNSLTDSRDLAAHAQQIGADAISATCPAYFPLNNLTQLVGCMSNVASAAPNLPFYYYHIPIRTGLQFDMVEFLELGSRRIPNLTGLKYSDTTIHGFQACLEFDPTRFEVAWGCDEMLLAALSVGAQTAIGTTYNFAAPHYLRLIAAFHEGRIDEARELQSQVVHMARTIAQFPFHPGLREAFRMVGVDVGPSRLPQQSLSPHEVEALRERLQQIGFLEWCRG